MSRVFAASNSILGIIEEIDLADIHPSFYQLRKNVQDSIDELAASISEKGLLQPIIVRMRKDHFEIVAGTRRYYACKKLRWRKIICHVVELADKEAFEVLLTENVQKRTLSAIEEAYAFKDYVKDYGWGGMSELATKLGKSVSYVSKRIKLLNLPVDVIDSISNSNIDTSIAEEMLCVTNKSKQSELAELISKRNISLRKARRVIKELENEPQSGLTSVATIEEYDVKKAQKSFDKSIIALRIALNKLASIIQENDENWLVYETLMQHKNMVHDQINLLIKHKKKYKTER